MCTCVCVCGVFASVPIYRLKEQEDLCRLQHQHYSVGRKSGPSRLRESGLLPNPCDRGGKITQPRARFFAQICCYIEIEASFACMLSFSPFSLSLTTNWHPIPG